MKNFWSLKGWIQTSIATLVIYGFFWFTFSSIDKSEAQTRKNGYQSGLGHAMKYADVPVFNGKYEVVVVIDKWKGTAVIKKVPQNFEETEPLLVTDMMPNMMEPGFTFRKSGSSGQEVK